MTDDKGGVGAGALYGTLDVMILKTLSDGGPMHGLSIARHIKEISDAFLQVEAGAMYPALHRLQRQGLIEGEWRISDKRRRARFYDLTSAGRKVLSAELDDWVRHTNAVSKVLGLKGAEAR